MEWTGAVFVEAVVVVVRREDRIQAEERIEIEHKGGGESLTGEEW